MVLSPSKVWVSRAKRFCARGSCLPKCLLSILGIVKNGGRRAGGKIRKERLSAYPFVCICLEVGEITARHELLPAE